MNLLQVYWKQTERMNDKQLTEHGIVDKLSQFNKFVINIQEFKKCLIQKILVFN